MKKNIVILFLLIAGWGYAQKPAYLASKFTNGLRDFFVYYDSCFEARHHLPGLFPWLEKDRVEIKEIVRKSLAIKEEWIPVIKTDVYKRQLILICITFVLMIPIKSRI